MIALVMMGVLCKTHTTNYCKKKKALCEHRTYVAGWFEPLAARIQVGDVVFGWKLLQKSFGVNLSGDEEATEQREEGRDYIVYSS
jgi:hypothetical protein